MTGSIYVYAKSSFVTESVHIVLTIIFLFCQLSNLKIAL